MSNNIMREDLDEVIRFLETDPILTQSKNVAAFEQEWSHWLGVKYSVFLNSGSSANLATMSALRYLYGECEIIVPTLTWVSDIASVLQCGHKPIFVDIDPFHLGMAEEQVFRVITDKTKAVFITHILGFNALSDKLIKFLKEKNILLIEDCCESHGATHRGQKIGSIGFASNFSFYYAHHMSTIEGGVVSTNDSNFYQVIRMIRSHGMVRELTDEKMKSNFIANHPDLNYQFIFAMPAYNFRSTEINAVIGRSQLKRLDLNNQKRNENFNYFLSRLDNKRFFTEFKIDGMSNYALILIMREKDQVLRDRIMERMSENKIEFRRGTSGGGNQLRQPYLKPLINSRPEDFPRVDHVHFYGFYLGNYPDLKKETIDTICNIVNS
jgi:CDP-6-deoxy-D-xylo-4-hexulose-3-dehydrase